MKLVTGARCRESSRSESAPWAQDRPCRAPWGSRLQAGDRAAMTRERAGAVIVLVDGVFPQKPDPRPLSLFPLDLMSIS